jgi:hypothetical protein
MMSFLPYITGFFMNFELLPILTDYGAEGHNFERGPSKDHFSKNWLRLAQQCQRRRFFLISSPLFSNLHNRSKWVMGFTSF